MTEKKLLPCPFCGRAADVDEEPDGRFATVFCDNGECAGHNVNSTPEQWNTRPPVKPATERTEDEKRHVEILTNALAVLKEVQSRNWKVGEPLTIDEMLDSCAAAITDLRAEIPALHRTTTPAKSEDAERLQQIRERCEKASSGPWVVGAAHHTSNQPIEIMRENVLDKSLVTLRATAWKPERWADARPNAQFIAHARTDIPFLLQAIAERDAEVESLRELREMILREVPELEREGFENIWGYLVHWDEIIKVCNQAWPTPRGYSQSPVELIIAIINERDQLRAQVSELQGKGKE